VLTQYAGWIIAALTLLALLTVGFYGQPAAAQENRQRIAVQATQIASYQATLYARPTSTPARRPNI